LAEAWLGTRAAVGLDKDRDRERGFAVSEGGVTVVSKGRMVEP
jgi:hypothetical protein